MIAFRHMKRQRSLPLWWGLLFFAGCMQAERLGTDTNSPQGMVFAGIFLATADEGPLFPVVADVTVNGLSGEADLSINGGEARTVTSNGAVHIEFASALPAGRSFHLGIVQRSTFALESGRKTWKTQDCTTDPPAPVATDGKPLSIEILCTNTASVSDPRTGLTWMRCSSGQAYDAVNNACTGAPGFFRFCSRADDSCNDTAGASGDLPPLGGAVTGHLHGQGSSPAYAACSALNEANAGTGTHGRRNWRVPRFAELAALLVCSPYYPYSRDCNVDQSQSLIDPMLFPNTPPAAVWSSAAASSSDAYFVAFGVVAGNSHNPKNDADVVRCVAGP